MSGPRHLRSTVSRALPSTHLFEPGRDRKGAAAVEFAIVLPLFLLLVVGALDVGRAVMVQHKLAEAARAGCRLYTLKNEVTEDDVRAIVDKVMADANIGGYAVELDPYPPTAIEHLSPVTVSVSVPYNQASWCSSWFLSGKTLVATCIMPGDAGEVSRDSGGGTGSPGPPSAPP